MKIRLITSLLTLLYTFSFATEPTFNFPEGMKGGFEMETGEILKVYSAELEGARFRAYVVEWNGEEIIVSDPTGSSDKAEGEIISFMANKIEFNQEGKEIKILQFMTVDFPIFDDPTVEPTDFGTN